MSGILFFAKRNHLVEQKRGLIIDQQRATQALQKYRWSGNQTLERPPHEELEHTALSAARLTPDPLGYATKKKRVRTQRHKYDPSSPLPLPPFSFFCQGEKKQPPRM